MAVVALLAVAGLRLVGARTGDLATRAGMDRILGGRLTGARCDLHFPREKPRADAERLFRDCEADVAEVAAALGVSPPPLVKVWVHRSPEEKRRLVGAGRTEFTKPWLAELQVLDAPGGPPALRHEIVHAVGGAVAGGPLGVPARLGVLVDAGLVEGLAVALEVPRGEWTVHEWARAMKDLGLLPPAARLVEPTGFFSAPAARAYGASGSFLAFLLDRRGPEPVLRAYAGAPFAEAFGAPIERPGALLARLPRRAGRPTRAGRLQPRPASARPGCSDGGARGRPPGSRPAPGPPARGGIRRERPRCGAAPPTSPAIPPTCAPSATPSGGPTRPRPTRPTGRRSLRSGRARRPCAPPSSSRAGTWPGDPGMAPARSRATARRWRSTRTARASGCSPPRSPWRPHRHLAAAAPWFLGTGEAVAATRALAASGDPLGAYLAGRAAAAGGDPASAIPLLERALAGPLPSLAFRVEALSTLAAARCRRGRLGRRPGGLGRAPPDHRPRGRSGAGPPRGAALRRGTRGGSR